MNNAYLDVLRLRRPPLNYVTPAICDAVFSSTSFPTLILNALPVKTAITGLHIRFVGDTGDFELTWDNYPGAICYSVYKLNDANDPFGDYTIIAECMTDPLFRPDDWEPDFDPDVDVCYLVTAITAEGETALSDLICKPPTPPPTPPPDGGGGGCISNLTPLPDAELGAEYSVTFLPVGPAAGPLWTISGGAVPAGLTLEVGTGVLSGTSTEDGEFDFTVRLTKDGGGFCEKAFHMTVLFGCQGNTTDIAALPWIAQPNAAWVTGSIAYPTGTFNAVRDLSTSAVTYSHPPALFCNPTDRLFSANFAGNTDVSPFFPTTTGRVRIRISLNSVFVQDIFQDFTGSVPFSLDASVMIPGEVAANSLSVTCSVFKTGARAVGASGILTLS